MKYLSFGRTKINIRPPFQFTPPQTSGQEFATVWKRSAQIAGRIAAH
jgi:hypothetical protein